MSLAFNESVVEQAALAWLGLLGYTVKNGLDIAPDSPTPERDDFTQVILRARLKDALARLNPALPPAALADAYRRLAAVDAPSLAARNHRFHRMLVDGVTVEYPRADGSIAGAQARLLDYDDPDNNDWLAVNQFTILENKHNRRPDIILFVNGLPLAVLELKNAAAENATIWNAFDQLQTYKAQIPSLFAYNTALLISDGVYARLGSLTADKEWFHPWRTITGEELTVNQFSELQTVLEGVFEKRRFLNLIRYFTVFEESGGAEIKKIAGYHQFHAVNVAVEETLRAARLPDPARRTLGEPAGRYLSRNLPGGKPGDGRAGVIWHTQGSGKSLTMAFYAGRLIQHPGLHNPTLVVITDRNDLDDQLFGVFSRCRELLRQAPVQAESRWDLREKLKVASGGVVFTTIQKFLPDERGDRHPLLSERSNIVVIADEAHRSQYDFVGGFAAHLRDALPNASYIGFTGTPIELSDRSTRAVFGDYISIYDIQQAVLDGATVPIYYESRLARLGLNEAERPRIDPEFEEATEGEEVEGKEKLKTRWAQLEAIVGAERRLELIAQDLVLHLEDRLAALEGKAMIVCMSRRICVDLYNALVALRPDWHGEDDEHGLLKVVMTGSASDKLELQSHIRSKARREDLARRFRDPADPFQIVIVRDMWLTGFDAPSLHTMYVDKPMRGHGLMQAIARVNRVFRDKPGGLVVDYIGLADFLREALITYTESGGAGETAIDQEQAVLAMQEKYEVCRGLFYGFDRSLWTAGSAAQRLTLLCHAAEHILAQENGKNRLISAVSNLSKAYTLAVPSDEALAIRDDVAFFQAVRSALAKKIECEGDGKADVDHAIRQIISKAIAPEEVVDIFAVAGLKKPDISILSDAFLAEVRNLPQKNLAVELLSRLLNDEIKTRGRKNVVQARSFADMLERALRRYQNRLIETAQVIEELIAMAGEMKQAAARGEALGLNDDELAFYDALETAEGAVEVMGDEKLRIIARELVESVRKNVTIDWTLRENVQAHLRVIVKRILRRHGYPPKLCDQATRTVLEQAAVLSAAWAIA